MKGGAGALAGAVPSSAMSSIRWMAATASHWTCDPLSIAAVDGLARDLGASQAVAQVLVRRGYDTVERAGRFITAGERHDPRLLHAVDDACASILAHVARGSRIVVHGDYDVDGIASTAVAVEAIRAVGGDPSWRVPDRLEGYGLSEATVGRLAAEGTGLLVTVDCGVTAVAEVAAARACGIDVVVTDHHRPGDELPDCPVVHPGVGAYPFDGLCAAGVAHKLSIRLRELAGLDAGGAEEELDLVALATVCDLVPLVDENRRIVREGLRALARTRRPGLRALMRIAALEPGEIDERAVGFRLGPRLNAAGRMRRADAALELVMTRDEGRAAEVADELDLLNRDRRDAETRILFAAEAARADQADAPAYVLAGEGWHPGVVGIVASRMTERHHRPCLVIGIEPDGARGSGRSIPAFDLHAALAACAPHLRRYGGHRAAAGLEIDPDRIDALRRDFVAHAARVLSPEDLVPPQEVDAVVSGTALGLPLAEELRALGPFGKGNPEPTLLVPAARLTDLRAMGGEGQHSRFTLASAGARAEGVAFRATPASLRREAGESCDAAIRLELREWNGVVEPRAVLASVCATEPGECDLLGEAEGEFWPVLQAGVAGAADLAVPGGVADEATVPNGAVAGVPERAVRDRRGEGIAGVAGELLASGESVLVACTDVPRRRETLERLLAGLARRPAGLPVISWQQLARDGAPAGDYMHVLAIDPPRSGDQVTGLSRASSEAGGGFCHLAWGLSEIEFARGAARAALDLRPALVELYRGLREAGASAGDALRTLLAGTGRHPRPPGECARLVRVLVELGLVEWGTGTRGEARCRALVAERTSLERSATFRACARELEQAERSFVEEETAVRARLAAARSPVRRGALGARPEALPATASGAAAAA